MWTDSGIGAFRPLWLTILADAAAFPRAERCCGVMDAARPLPLLAGALLVRVPGAWHPVAGRCFPCAYGELESPTSPPTSPRSGARHGAMTIETPVLRQS